MKSQKEKGVDELAELLHDPEWRTKVGGLVTGFLLLGVGFLAGIFWQHGKQTEKVVVEVAQSSQTTPDAQPLAVAASAATNAPETTFPVECLFVASSRGKKYHRVTTGPAKQIKVSNRQCFPTEDAAKKAGFVAGTL